MNKTCQCGNPSTVKSLCTKCYQKQYHAKYRKELKPRGRKYNTEVFNLRQEEKYTFQQIGDMLGISKQAASNAYKNYLVAMFTNKIPNNYNANNI
jgi:hypothetical protein